MPVIVKLAGEYDLANTDALQRTLRDALEAADDHTLSVDLASVTFIDTRGWRTIRDASVEARSRGGEVELVGVATADLRVLQVLGFDQVLRIRSDS